MINLIPKEEKVKMIRGFYYRLAVVFLLAFSFPILIGVGVMTPSYFLIYVKQDLVDKKLEKQKTEPVPLPDQETLAVIKDVNNKLSIVERARKNDFIFSQKVIAAILVEKIPNVKITGISYEINSQNEESLESRKISIEGTAPSREVLLLFRQALEDSSAFKSVDLPISNFVKGSNIQFYLNLIPA